MFSLILSLSLAATGSFAVAQNTSTSLATSCTVSHVQDALSANNSYVPGTVNNITFILSSVTANAVSSSSGYNSSNSSSIATSSYCNVTFSYSHGGRGDSVLLQYYLPAPSSFRNRYLSTGGGGFSITSGSRGLTSGISYGAVTGTTDGGFGGDLESTFLIQNGTINRQNLYMFGYDAIHELSVIGKQLTKNFYGMVPSQKLYAYYSGCSEGGREGWSQIQRFGDEWDGAVTGAPAFRFSFQQTQHLYSNVVEKTLNYYPPSCEFDKILNETIKACDPLDGRVDGVVSRSDLCKLQFNLTSLIGMTYSCSASSGGGIGPPGGAPTRRQLMGQPGMGGSPYAAPPAGRRAGPRGPPPGRRASPAQSGAVTAQGVAVVQTIMDGLKDSAGRQAYFSYQPSAGFSDAATAYNSTTKTWGLSINSMGGGWIARFLQLRDASNLDSLDGVTYDTLKDWMIQGWQKYQDSLETTWPDLTPFQKAGGKILHYHGESDDSIPAASSVRYQNSVRSVMYPDLSFAEGYNALRSWYKLFLIPGAGHCGRSSSQPNGPWPTDLLQTLIDWVESGVEPVRLNATVTSGNYQGSQPICSWPLRPLWSGNGTMDCVYETDSVNSWLYDLDAIPNYVY